MTLSRLFAAIVNMHRFKRSKPAVLRLIQIGLAIY
jgi:hypothetical protein